MTYQWKKLANIFFIKKDLKSKLFMEKGKMEGEFFKGDIFDICAELEREARKHKGMTVGEWLSFRKLDRIVKKQIDEIEKSIQEGR